MRKNYKSDQVVAPPDIPTSSIYTSLCMWVCVWSGFAWSVTIFASFLYCLHYFIISVANEHAWSTNYSVLPLSRTSYHTPSPSPSSISLVSMCLIRHMHTHTAWQLAIHPPWPFVCVHLHGLNTPTHTIIVARGHPWTLFIHCFGSECPPRKMVNR